MEKNEVEGGLIGENVITAITRAGDDVTYHYQYELLKAFCEYHARQLVSPP